MMKIVQTLVCATILMSGTAIAGGGNAHWGYSGHEGPEHWGDLAPEYSLCKEGKNQSPVDITGALNADLPAISVKYSASAVDVVNNGHTVKVNYAAGNTLEVDGKTFNLLQYHFHSPSENAINGKLFPMEAHLVHADADGNLAVLAVMFVEGKANSVLEAVWANMPTQAGDTAKPEGVAVNVRDLLPASLDYYRFNGSLTTPPCSEGVRWMVLKQAVDVSKEQVEKLHHTMHHDTNRPVQPLNARKIIR